jgi:hypothetical protein
MSKFTLRDLFAVLTIVAVALGWVVDRSRLRTEHAASLRNVQIERTRRIEAEANADRLHRMWARERATNTFLQRDLQRLSAARDQGRHFE